MKISKVELLNSQKTSVNSSFKGSVAVSSHQNLNEISKTANEAIRNLYKAQIASPYAVISFCGKNTNKAQAAIVGAELPPYCKVGGVGAVMNDYKVLLPENSGSMFIPYYNGAVQYDPKTGDPTGIAKVHKVTIDGRSDVPIYTGADLNKKTIDEVISGGKAGKDFFELEEISTKKMPFGLNAENPIGLYKVKGTNHYMVYTPATANMPKPYAGGIAYATDAASKTHGWSGSPYAEFDKAFVELLPDLENKGFSPETVICSDAQCAYIPQHMAQKHLAGSEFYSGMKPSYVGHNVGKGYTGFASGREMFVNMGATPEQIKKIEADPDFIKALCEGEGSVNKYFKNIMPDVFDETANCFSPTLIPLRYAQQGYLSSFDVVAEQYAADIANNPKASPVLNKAGWDKLFKEGKVGGIANALNDPTLTPYELTSIPTGYKNPTAITNKGEFVIGKITEDNKTIFETMVPDPNDSTKKIAKALKKSEIKAEFEPFKAFKKGSTLDEMLSVKNYNKSLLLERLSGKYQQPEVLNGLCNGRYAGIIGGIDPKYAKMAKEGDPVNLLVSWGRADNQKGFDITLRAFEKFAKTKEGKNSVLVAGATLTGENNGEIPVIQKNITRLLEDKEISGRFAFIDGFAPAHALSSAGDAAIFTSRFEPCGLTDLEAMKKFCTPIVTNTQGLAQKNFDPRIASELDKATSYKTKHEFLLDDGWIGKIKNAFNGTFDKANQTDVQKEVTKEFSDVDTGIFEKFAKAYKKLIDAETGKLKAHGVNSDKIADIAKKAVEKTDEYAKIEKELCDDILVDETFAAMKAQATQSKDIAEKIFKNHVALQTDWDASFIHPSGLSARELYKQRHMAPDPIAPQKTLLENVGESVSEIGNSGKKGLSSIMDKINDIPFKGRIGIAIGAAAAVAGGAYLILNKNKKTKETENKDDAASYKPETPASQPQTNANVQPAQTNAVNNVQPAQTNTTSNTTAQTTVQSQQNTTVQTTPQPNLMNNFVNSTK